MPEIELILTTKGGEEVKTTIQAIQNNLAKARKELDEFYKSQKKSFSDPKDLETWNNKFKELNNTINDGEEVLKQYNKQAEETAKEQGQQEKQADSLVGKLGKLAAQYLSITLILNKLKTAFLETTQGMSLMNQGMAAMNQIVHNIVSGVGQWNHGVIEAIALAKKMSEIRVKENVQMLQAKKLMQEYNKLYTAGIDQTISSTDKIAKLTKAKENFPSL
jgi:chromosome segregation ATPase